jgi:hypothetical protein
MKSTTFPSFSDGLLAPRTIVFGLDATSVSRYDARSPELDSTSTDLEDETHSEQSSSVFGSKEGLAPRLLSPA